MTWPGRSGAAPAGPAHDLQLPRRQAAAMVGLGLLAGTRSGLGAGAGAGGRVWRVGRSQALRRIADAAAAAQDGDVVEIEAGDYIADTAVWHQRRVSVRAVGGRVRLQAAGASAQDKAIWVVRCDDMDVAGIEFSGARVADRNGAGIRHERGRLQLRNCRFIDNENGLLAGNDPQAELDLVDCEFGHNGAGDGRSHNLYAGRIARLRALGCHFHHARVGHLLKSRAAVSAVLACRLDDGADGRASYELEFPEGGDALVVGNLIAQSALSQNPSLLSFAAEGLRGNHHRLLLLHNTFVDRLPAGGRFIDLHRLAPDGVLQAFNNLRAGSGHWPGEAASEAGGNLPVPMSAFRGAHGGDFRLTSPAAAAWRASPLPAAVNAPAFEIAWPQGHRAAERMPRWIGALPPDNDGAGRA